MNLHYLFNPFFRKPFLHYMGIRNTCRAVKIKIPRLAAGNGRGCQVGQPQGWSLETPAAYPALTVIFCGLALGALGRRRCSTPLATLASMCSRSISLDRVKLRW